MAITSELGADRSSMVISSSSGMLRTVGANVLVARWTWGIAKPLLSRATAYCGKPDLCGPRWGFFDPIRSLVLRSRRRSIQDAITSVRQLPMLLDQFADAGGAWPLGSAGGQVHNSARSSSRSATRARSASGPLCSSSSARLCASKAPTHACTSCSVGSSAGVYIGSDTSTS